MKGEQQRVEIEADRLRKNHPSDWVRAQVIPFGVFMLLLLVLQGFASFFQDERPSAPWWLQAPEHWVYALQTLICLGLMARWWRFYEFRWSWKWSAWGVLFGAVGIGFWLLPTTLHAWLELPEDGDGWWTHLGVEARRDGFNPANQFGAGTGGYWLALVMRFVRAVIVVALVEEIFWRSFVMRLVLDWEGDYWKKPFGRPSWLSFAVVTGLFVLAHAPVDYVGALIYGSLTYLLCVWSRNLGACVVMHAVANLLMGWYAMVFEKFGLW